MTARLALLNSVALLMPLPAYAQQAETAPSSSTQSPAPTAGPTDQTIGDEEDEATVTVVGQKPRGSVVGDIPAENVLTSRDIRSTGATSIQELLDAIAPQTGSARGRGAGGPVLLLNGQRISGFRELRDVPPEAIERLEILPEEVALKYGYSADQRVVNIVLRQRFDATTVTAQGKAATDGGYQAGSADGSKFIIGNGKRTNLAVHVEGNTPLYESERDITLQAIGQPTALDPRASRTLVGSASSARLSGSFNRPLGTGSLTLSPEVSINRGGSALGLATGTLTPPGGDPILRAFDDTLRRRTDSESAGLGASLNGTSGKWRWSGIANAQVDWSRSRSDRGPDFGDFQARLDAGDPTFDPLGELGPLVDLPDDRSRSTVTSLSASSTLNGPLADLPAGTANATFKAGGSYTAIRGHAFRRGIGSDTDLSRTEGDLSANLDLPLAKRDSKIGRLTANVNGALSQLSDFGTLKTFGAGLNWAPAPRLSLLGSWTLDENAPTVNQLGDPVVSTSGTPFFDAVRGQTVDVTAISGGNPGLAADRRNVVKVGGNWQPWETTDLRLRADFVHQRIDHPQLNFPAASAALEAAFPDRFVRDSSGRLVQVDLRPVNADHSVRDTLRIGFDFTKPLKSKPPSAAQIQALRDRFRRNAPQISTTPGGATAGQPGASAAAPTDRPRGGGGRGGGGRFGGGAGGRLTFSLTDTVTFTNRVVIAPGLPELDYLHGEAIGLNGGQPRHAVEAQGGYYNNGLGARLSANWRSATKVDSATSGDLHFSDYATFDLRLFANLGERFDLVSKSPFFLGSSVRLDITNIFNARPRVTGPGGVIPLAYEADRLEPIGRTVGITFRKLFLPTRFFRIGGGGGGGFGGRGGGGGGRPGGGN